MSMAGDGSAVELAAMVRSSAVCGLVPSVLDLLPDAVPCPPVKRSPTDVQHDQGSKVAALEDKDWQASPRPAMPLQEEAVMKVPAPVSAWDKSRSLADLDNLAPTVFGRTQEGLLPAMISSGGALPRGKAKAKSRGPKTQPEDISEKLESPVPVRLHCGSDPCNSSSNQDKVVATAVASDLRAKLRASDTAATHRNSGQRLIYQSDGEGSAAEVWQSVLERTTKELSSTRVVLWLQLGGLRFPKGVVRPVDAGVRIQIGPTTTSRVVESFENEAEALAEVGIREEVGWLATEIGSSFFSHGPLMLFSMQRAPERPRELCDKLFAKVAPPSLIRAVRNLASGKDVRTGVRTENKDGKLRLGARFELVEAANSQRAGIDLQSLAVDLALGRERLFDAFLVERVRQTFRSLGGDAVVSAIECRANDTAVVTLQISASA
jgi:hypothetical protein